MALHVDLRYLVAFRLLYKAESNISVISRHTNFEAEAVWLSFLVFITEVVCYSPGMVDLIASNRHCI